MTEINATGDERRRAGVRSKMPVPRMDMTPMVDLGFLLITFFVMTSRLSEPSVVKFNMHKEGPPMKLGNSNALTVLLDKDNRIYYYNGNKEEAFANNQVFKTSFSVANGLGQIIRDKQLWLDSHGDKEGRNGLMMLIKPPAGASYKNVIDALDETMINVVKKYTILPAEPQEIEWLKKQ
jgi:biopolymer transport protein ExbD